MSDDIDLSPDEQRALDGLRSLIGEVIRLDQEYVDTASIYHPGDRGNEREAALLEVFRYRFGRIGLLHCATVQDRDGTVYGQHDVVFADPRVQPHRMLRYSGRVLIESRGVHGVIEVKSTLTSSKLRDSLDHLARLKSAARCEMDGTYRVTIGDREFPYTPICGGIFAYRSELKLSTIAAQVQDWARQHPHEQWPNFIVVLDRGMVAWCDPTTGDERAWPHAGDVTMWFELGDPCSPLVGLVTVMESLCQNWRTPHTPWQKPTPHVHGPVGMTLGQAVRPPGVPIPPKCDHECANCHHYGRMSFAEQR